MARPVTMFTGQWADLPVAELARKCKGFGYAGWNWLLGTTGRRAGRRRPEATLWRRTACRFAINHPVGQAVLT